MAGNSDIANHTLAILRKLDERTERMAEDLHDLKVRMSSIEANIAAMAQLNFTIFRFDLGNRVVLIRITLPVQVPVTQSQ